MKKLLYALVFFPVLSSAADINLNWTLPTTAENGTPLTGAQAITSIQVYLATATIPNNSGQAPTATLTGTPTTIVQPFVVNVGQTVFARLRACNSAGCSAFSAEKSILVPGSVPGVPTNVTITITINP